MNEGRLAAHPLLGWPCGLCRRLWLAKETMRQVIAFAYIKGTDHVCAWCFPQSKATKGLSHGICHAHLAAMRLSLFWQAKRERASL